MTHTYTDGDLDRLMKIALDARHGDIWMAPREAFKKTFNYVEVINLLETIIKQNTKIKKLEEVLEEMTIFP